MIDLSEIFELCYLAAFVVFCVWGSIHVLAWLKWLPACMCGV